ncbi:MAG TPA: SpoIIE family protein phosphatase [Candidatus Acidoferrales bacterium]|nr:SpoIIE family protein phosphatase [Candidatus Acidoferrales bacterium]
MKIDKPDWLEQMEGILETLNEGVLIADDCQHILFINERMEKLLGIPRSAILGKTPAAIYSGNEYQFLETQVETSRRRGHHRFEFFVPRQDGSRVPVIVSSRGIEDPDGRMFGVVTFTDITEQKKAENDLRDANLQLQMRAEEIQRDLVLAARVQQSLAPRTLEWGSALVETYYKPVLSIGGDFGLVSPHGKHLDLLICDVSGHGISSALLANRIYTETVSLLRGGAHTGRLLQRLNEFVVKQIGISGFMFTMAAARLDEDGRRLTFSAGGHPPAFWISPSGEVRYLEARSTILGAIEDAVSEDSIDVYDFSPGDRLMIYSDGLTEVWDAEGEMLGIEGLAKLARQTAALPLSAMREAVIRGVVGFSATPVHDDMSLVLLEVR